MKEFHKGSVGNRDPPYTN